MDAKPIILGLLFIVLAVVLFNPPSGGGSGKHEGHGDKPGGKKH
jgi:hypothetical protein